MTKAASVSPDGQIFSQEAISIVRQHWAVVIGAPVAVGLLAYAGSFAMPVDYTSSAYLRLDRTEARGMEALMTSSALSAVAVSAAGIDDPPAGISKILRVIDTDPLADAARSHLFRLDVTLPDPAAAQALSSSLVAGWRAETVPGTSRKRELEAELVRVEAAAKSVSELVSSLQSEITTLVLPNSLPGEVATPISNLIGKRDAYAERAAAIRRELAGVTTDAVVIEPNLPVRPSGPNRAVLSILAFLAAVPLVFAALVVARFAKASLPKRSSTAQRA